MPYDGNGNYVRVHNWVADAANSLDINATEMDAEDNGFSAALSNAVTRDGQGKMAVDFLPNSDNTLNLGSGGARWASLNGVAIPTGVSPWTITPRTAAEINASVNPTSLGYVPGHMLRYGAKLDGTTDDSTALASALLQAQQTNGSPVYVPASSGGSLIKTSPAALSAPVTIYGDRQGGSFFITPNDITILSGTVASSGSQIRDVKFVGKGTGATLPGILFTNSNNNYLQRVGVQGFGYGVQFATGINSCFSNTLDGCRIISNQIRNIDGQANTNALCLKATTFGGAPTQTGLKLIDSNTLTIIGGDVEGCSVCAIDLDATSTLVAGHVINGVHIEANTSSGGDIRIGNTAAVNGVHIVGAFYPGAGSIAGINAVNCNGLFVRYILGSGYTNVPFLQKTTLTNEDIAPFGPSTNGLNYRQNNAKFNYVDQSVIGFSAATSYDSSYQDSSNYNQYRIQSGSVTANKNYYAGLDAIEMTATTTPGAGAKLYARGMIAANDLGGATKVGAAYMQGDVDINGKLGVAGQATTGAQTATFTATNKPGSGTTAPTKWLPINLDGTTYYIPCWL